MWVRFIQSVGNLESKDWGPQGRWKHRNSDCNIEILLALWTKEYGLRWGHILIIDFQNVEIIMILTSAV